MKIAVGSDHAGYVLKGEVVSFLKDLGHEAIDLGTDSGLSVDYPDFAASVSKAVSEGNADLGLLVCGTGLGMAIAANKIRGIRAVTCSDTFSARASREHNNANILCLGARVIGPGVALDIVRVWLESEFQEGRHTGRVSKIMDLESIK